MTDQLMAEGRLPLSALAVELGVNRKTVVRWADEGYRGHRLEHYRIGKRRFTSKQAASRFLAALNSEPAELAGT